MSTHNTKHAPNVGVRILAWVNTVLGVVGTGLGVWVIYYGILFASEARELKETPPVDPCGAFLGLLFQPFFKTLSPVLLILGGATVLTHSLMFISAFGLVQRASWGRTLTLIAAVLFLVTGGVVIGAAYSLPVFLLLYKPEWKELFCRSGSIDTTKEKS